MVNMQLLCALQRDISAHNTTQMLWCWQLLLAKTPHKSLLIIYRKKKDDIPNILKAQNKRCMKLWCLLFEGGQRIKFQTSFKRFPFFFCLCRHLTMQKNPIWCQCTVHSHGTKTNCTDIFCFMCSGSLSLARHLTHTWRQSSSVTIIWIIEPQFKPKESNRFFSKTTVPLFCLFTPFLVYEV